MRLAITTEDGQSLEGGILSLLQRVSSALSHAGPEMSEVLQDETREHISQRFSGSKHWVPKKVQAEAGRTEGESVTVGSAAVNIPGATRAYHDVVIRPVARKFITIPLHASAYGVSPHDVPELFPLTTKSGKKFLAKIDGNALTFMWLLTKRAFQPQDKSIMPADESLASALLERISARITKD